MPILIACTLVVSLTGVLISNVTAMDAPAKVRKRRERRTPLPPLQPLPAPLSLCARVRVNKFCV